MPEHWMPEYSYCSWCPTCGEWQRSGRCGKCSIWWRFANWLTSETMYGWWLLLGVLFLSTLMLIGALA